MGWGAWRGPLFACFGAIFLKKKGRNSWEERSVEKEGSLPPQKKKRQLEFIFRISNHNQALGSRRTG